MACSGCNRDVSIENKDTNLCATCNKEARDDRDLYPVVRQMFLDKMIADDVECPITGTPITMDSDIHHKKGRIGYADQWAREKGITLLNDVRFFLAVSRPGHQWIEDPKNRKIAERLGYMLTRQDTDNG